MSKQIDFSKPLSEEDEEYVDARPWLRRDAELAGIDLSSETDFSLEEEDGDDETDGFESEGEESEDESEDEGEGDEDEEEEEQTLPYSEWEYADLKAEAGARELPKSGSKEQLIERLEANDRENAE